MPALLIAALVGCGQKGPLYLPAPDASSVDQSVQAPQETVQPPTDDNAGQQESPPKSDRP